LNLEKGFATVELESLALMKAKNFLIKRVWSIFFE
jgi:hypothetical protein